MDQQQGCIDSLIDIATDDGRLVPLKVETTQVIAPSRLAENIAVNLERDLPRFVQASGFNQLRGEPLAIVAAGPTLNHTIEKVREFDNVLVCGSAHDHLIRLGVIPTYALVSDGGKEDKGNLSMPQKETIYLLASQCDPSLFDQLDGYKVEMWHYRGQSGTPEEEAALLKGELPVAWGSTVTINAVEMAMRLGFQDLHFFGFDSCYGNYGLDHHCCKIAGSLDYQKMLAKVGDREFISDMGLMEQASQFFRMVEASGQFFHSTIHGDGLIAAMVRYGDPGLSQFVSLA